MTTFQTGTSPDQAYETWLRDWQPPEPRPRAIPGFVIVEFSPYSNRGAIWTPERASNNAVVVSDGYEGRYHREGFLPCGTEVGYTGTEGDAFQWRGRNFMRVPKAEVEMYFPREAA